jgi:hypothetical protein
MRVSPRGYGVGRGSKDTSTRPTAAPLARLCPNPKGTITDRVGQDEDGPVWGRRNGRISATDPGRRREQKGSVSALIPGSATPPPGHGMWNRIPLAAARARSPPASSLRRIQPVGRQVRPGVWVHTGEDGPVRHRAGRCAQGEIAADRPWPGLLGGSQGRHLMGSDPGGGHRNQGVSPSQEERRL